VTLKFDLSVWNAASYREGRIMNTKPFKLRLQQISDWSKLHIFPSSFVSNIYFHVEMKKFRWFWDVFVGFGDVFSSFLLPYGAGVLSNAEPPVSPMRITHFVPYVEKRKISTSVTIRYDTIDEFNVDSKAEYTA